MSSHQTAATSFGAMTRCRANSWIRRLFLGWMLFLACPVAAQPLTITVRDNLGADKAAVEALVANNPLVRLHNAGAFQISRALFSPDYLVLIDMNNADLVEIYDSTEPLITNALQSQQDMIVIPEENRSALGLTGEIELGRFDSPVFSRRFDAAILSLMHVRALEAQAARAPLSTDDFLLCIEPPDRDCPESGNSFLPDLNNEKLVRVGVSNRSGAEKYTYLLLAKPDGQLLLLIGNDAVKSALANGESAELQGDPLVMVDGDYRLFIIMSPTPIAPDLLLSPVGVPANPSTALDFGPGARIFVARFAVDDTTNPRVGGGNIAEPDFAPWQVQIFSTQTYSAADIEADRKAGDAGRALWEQEPYQRYHRCAGSIIGENLVLTAAHCVAGNEHVAGTKVLTSRAVRAGTQNLTYGGAIYRIMAVVVHAGYRPGSQKDDIALLRIAPKGRAVAAMRPILLPDAVPGLRRIGAGSRMEVLGWGFTEEVARGERHERLNSGARQFATELLRIAPMVAMAEADCRRIRGYANIHKKICASTPPEERSRRRTFSCRNDSGGPVIQRLNRSGDLVQVGLVSGGVGCGAIENGVQNPSLFVDLQLFGSWIAAARARIATLNGTVVSHPEP